MNFMIYGFAAFAVAYTIQMKRGPFGLLLPLRRLPILNCWLCASFWLGLLFQLASLASNVYINVLIWSFAGLGVAILVGAMTGLTLEKED